MAFTKIAAAGIGSTETVTLDGLSVINNGSFGGNLTVGGVLTYEDVTNVDSIGLITARNGIVVGSGITLSKDGDGFYTGVVTATTFSGAFTGDGSALTGVANTNVIFTDKVSLGDNERVALGIGSDLSLLHDGSQSYIINSTGNLDIRTGSDSIDIQSNAGSENMAKFIPDGAVELYHNNNKKLETASGGVTVTGTVAATSYTGDGSSLTGIAATANVRTGILDVAGVSTFRNTMNVGAAVTISESGIEASGIGITVANINGGQLGGRRNLVINGAMLVNERGSSSTSTGYQTCDRWQFGGTYNGTATQSQEDIGYTTVPYDLGFRKSYKITNGNNSSAGAGDNMEITYGFEGQDIANSGWDYVNSKAEITLSFWVKSSVAQTFYGYFRTFEGTSAKFSFPIVCSTTNWEFKTVSVGGESNFASNVYNSFRNDNSRDLIIRIVPFYGTTYTDSGAINNAWQNYSSSTITPDYATTWFLTNGATFELTGVQLEVGTQATAFEHRTYAEEIQLCKRYYQRLPGYGDHYMFGLARAESNSARTGIPVPVPMRAAPTVACNGSRTFKDGYNSESTDTPTIVSSSDWISSSSTYTIDFGGHNLAHNNMYALMSKTTGKNALTLDAEV